MACCGKKAVEVRTPSKDDRPQPLKMAPQEKQPEVDVLSRPNIEESSREELVKIARTPATEAETPMNPSVSAPELQTAQGGGNTLSSAVSSSSSVTTMGVQPPPVSRITVKRVESSGSPSSVESVLDNSSDSSSSQDEPVSRVPTEEIIITSIYEAEVDWDEDFAAGKVYSDIDDHSTCEGSERTSLMSQEIPILEENDFRSSLDMTNLSSESLELSPIPHIVSSAEGADAQRHGFGYDCLTSYCLNAVNRIKK